jgi:hypothetical protein
MGKDDCKLEEIWRPIQLLAQLRRQKLIDPLLPAAGHLLRLSLLDLEVQGCNN